jgi:hypothetical protein
VEGRGACCPVPVRKWVNGRGGVWGVQTRGGEGKGCGKTQCRRVNKTNMYKYLLYLLKNPSSGVTGLLGSQKPRKQEKHGKTQRFFRQHPDVVDQP